jgi:hypothetical protein
LLNQKDIDEKSNFKDCKRNWNIQRRFIPFLLLNIDFLFWQTPHLFDIAESSKHFFVFFVNGRSFLQVDKMDHVSMGTGHLNRRIEATNLSHLDLHRKRWRCASPSGKFSSERIFSFFFKA